MSTRKIIDPKQNGEKVWLKGHAQAIYMSDGTTVEDVINNIKVGSGVDLSNYATKEELSSKQDIITDLEVIRQGAAKGDTALQSYTEQYKGTVTGVKVNGTTKNPSNGVVDIGTVITSHQDISGKQDILVSGTNIKTINGESILGEGNITIESGTEQIQADWNETDNTSKAYIANKPLIPTKTSELENDSRYAQFEESSVFGSKVLRLDAILSNDGIISNAYELTWNNNGLIVYDKSELENVINITKSGNGKLFLSDDGTYKSISTSYPQVNHGTSDTIFALTPNVLHVWDEVAELSLTLANPTDTNIANEYLFQFTSGATATTLTLPDNIKWANDAPIDIAENMIYQVSILNNCGTILGFI